MTVFLGVDTGFTGALWALNASEGTCTFLDMPILAIKKRGGKTEREIDGPALHQWLRSLTCRPEMVVAAVERVASRPGQGVTGMFRFGLGYGMVRNTACAGLAAKMETGHRRAGGQGRSARFGHAADAGLCRALPPGERSWPR